MAINNKRKGIIWIKNYQAASLAYLPFSDLCAQGFRDTLLPSGTGHDIFERADLQAVESDLQQVDPSAPRSAPQRGQDNLYAETVDILYFCGHGNQQGLRFGTRVPPDNDAEAACWDMQFGDDGNLKWFIADACEVLEDQSSVLSRWMLVFYGAMRSLRYILSFASISKNDNVRGRYFAEELNSGATMRLGWITACEKTDPAAAWAYLRVGDHSFTPVADDNWIDNHVADIPADQLEKFTYSSLLLPNQDDIQFEFA